MDSFKFLLKWFEMLSFKQFEMLSGLKINHGKCELIGVRTVKWTP